MDIRRIAVTNNKTNWTDFINGEVSNKGYVRVSRSYKVQIGIQASQPMYLFALTSPTGTGAVFKGIMLNLTGSDKKLLQEVGATARLIGIFKIKM